MTFDLKRMLESKKALRRKLADRPLAEKFAMLDALRERALAIRTISGPGLYCLTFANRFRIE